MLKIVHGFGSGINPNGLHLNAPYDGSDQSFPYTPITYTEPTSGFQPAWALNRNVIICMGGRA